MESDANYLEFQSPMTKQYDLSSLTFLLSGGAPLSVEVVDQIANILPNCMIAQGYGASSLRQEVSATLLTHSVKVRQKP